MFFRRLCIAFLSLVGIVIGVSFFLKFFAARHTDAPKKLSTLTDPYEILKTAEVLSWRGNWLAARPYFERSEAIFKSEDNQAMRIRAHLGLLRASLEYISLCAVSAEADQLLANPIVTRHPDLLIRALEVKAETSFHLDSDVCYDTLNKIRKLAIQLHDPAWANRASGDLGGIEFLRGNVFRGLVQFQTALLQAEFYGDVGAQMRYRSFLGQALAATHQYPSAKFFFESAIRLAGTVPGAEAPFSPRIGLARCLLASDQEQQQADGINQLRSFLNQAQAMNLQIRQLNILTALLGYYGSRDIFTAESANIARQCYTLASRHGLQHLAIYSEAFLIKYYLLNHNMSLAEQYAKSTIAAMRRSSDVYNLPGILWILATLQIADGQLDAADVTYKISMDTVDGLLRNIPISNERNTIIAASTPIYRDYVNFLIDKLGKPTKAFSLMERARAQSIEAHDSYDANFDRHSDSRIQSLTRAVYLDKRADLSGSLWEAETHATRFSSYANRRLPDIAVPSIAAIQKCLAPSEMIVAYFSSTPDSFAISITQHTFQSTRLLPATAFAQRVSALLSNVTLLKPTQTLAQELYAELVAPIPHIAEYSDLIIIPDATLNRLAFEMLLDSSGHYLVETHTVSYVPSATALQLLRSHTDRTPSAFLGVGGVNYGLDSSTRGIASPGARFEIKLNSFTDLPATAHEILIAESSVNTVDNKLLIGGDATEEKLKALRLDQYGVIDFAVHAVLDDQFSERNALLLGDLPSSHEDGLLQVREISQFRLRARLVILSSCISAVGPAEGLAVYGSLALAFLRAGAHSVVASDWYVDDRMTAKLMDYFYAHLARGMVASKALQSAKLDVMAKYGGDAPYYWAGFRIVGNGAERIRD